MALDRAWDGTDAVYMSFDIDCIEAGFVPGTGWPEPGGFLPREALKMVGLVAAEGLCGMEIVEVRAPHATPTGEEPATRRRPHSRTPQTRVRRFLSRR